MTIVQGLSIKEDRRPLFEEIREYAEAKHVSFSQAILDLAELGLEGATGPSAIQREILASLSRIEQIVSSPGVTIDVARPNVITDDARQQEAKRALLKGLLG